MKKGTVSKLLSITLALSMTLGSGSMAVFADDDAPAAEEIETAVVVEEEADAAQEAVEAEEAEAAEATEADTVVETVVQPEAEAVSEEAAPVEEIAVETAAADEAAEIEVVADEETEQEDAALADAEEFSRYVLMNIPYDAFYSTEVGEGGIDAVSAATKNKYRFYNLAEGSWHSAEGAGKIEGSVYPVKVKNIEAFENALKGTEAVEVKEDDKLSFEINRQGKITPVNLEGSSVLFERPAYSYYELKEEPAVYKELTIGEDGSFSFGKAEGTSKEGSITSYTVTPNGRHTDYEIKLEVPEDQKIEEAVSGVVITAGGKKYALGHVVHAWNKYELGWNLDEEAFAAITGNSITNVTYYTKNATYSFVTNIQVPKLLEGVTAEFQNASTIKINGLPEDITEAAVQVYNTRQEAKPYLTENNNPVKVEDGIAKLDYKADPDVQYTVVVTTDKGAAGSTAAYSLEQAKTDAKQALANEYDKSDYKNEQQDEIDKLIAAAYDQIDKATSAGELTSAVENAKNDLDKVKTAAQIDKAAADAVIAKLNALKGSASAAADQKTVEAVRAAYNALSADQKKLVSADALKKLTDSESAVANAIKNAQKPQTVTKQSQSLKKLTPTTKKLKASKLKKKKQTFKLKATINGQGKVTFKKVSGNKKIKISKAGKVTVKKGLKKGTYKVKVKVSIAASGNYTAASATKTIKIKVK